jgi:hypothetical protein
LSKWAIVKGAGNHCSYFQLKFGGWVLARHSQSEARNCPDIFRFLLEFVQFTAVRCLQNGVFSHDGDFGVINQAKHLSSLTVAVQNECQPPFPFTSFDCERF